MGPDDTSSAHGGRLARPAAALLVVVNLVLCLIALTMGFHIEGTSEAIEEAQRGQHVALAAVPGLLLAGAAFGWRRRAAVLTLLSAVCAVVAVVLVAAG